MSRPSKVDVLGHNWRIEWDVVEVDEGGRWAETREASQQIRIGAQTPETKAREALFHELLHVVENSVLTPQTKLKEAQVKPLSMVLHDTLLRNPEVADYIFGREG